MRVALIEDDPTVLALLAEVLRAHGHDPRPILISHADTVESGLDRLAAEATPVVVMDLGMPVSGFELLEAAHRDARFGALRYVVATASLDGARRLPPDRAIRSVSKPYDIPELLAAIEGT